VKAGEWWPSQTAANEGSAFAHRLVMVWSHGGHTYAVGFHDVMGRAVTKKLDFALLRRIRLVGPAG
jgi:hypothetical protein